MGGRPDTGPSLAERQRLAEAEAKAKREQKKAQRQTINRLRARQGAGFSGQDVSDPSSRSSTLGD